MVEKRRNRSRSSRQVEAQASEHEPEAHLAWPEIISSKHPPTTVTCITDIPNFPGESWSPSGDQRGCLRTLPRISVGQPPHGRKHPSAPLASYLRHRTGSTQIYRVGVPATQDRPSIHAAETNPYFCKTFGSKPSGSPVAPQPLPPGSLFLDRHRN